MARSISSLFAGREYGNEAVRAREKSDRPDFESEGREFESLRARHCGMCAVTFSN